MASFRWVFFDLFDTLCTVDEDKYYEGKRQAAEAAGVGFEPFLRAWQATSAAASTGEIRTPFARAERSLQGLGVTDKRIVSEVARLDVETIQQCVFYYEGAQEALAALRERGFSLGLISNATATTAFAIGPLGLRGRLDLLVFSYEAGVVKPDEKIYLLALGRAECSPREALFVGDGANRELDAAEGLGMEVFCMDHPLKALTFRDPDRLSRASHASVKSFAELLALPCLAEPSPLTS